MTPWLALLQRSKHIVQLIICYLIHTLCWTGLLQKCFYASCSWFSRYIPHNIHPKKMVFEGGETWAIPSDSWFPTSLIPGSKQGKQIETELLPQPGKLGALDCRTGKGLSLCFSGVIIVIQLCRKIILFLFLLLFKCSCLFPPAILILH